MRLTHVTFENYELDFSRLTSLNISQNLKIGQIGIENIRLLLKDAPMLSVLEAAQITVSDDIFTPLTKVGNIPSQMVRLFYLFKIGF